MEQLIDMIKAQGFTTITVVDSFSDGEFTQIEFSAPDKHIAFFKNDVLLVIS